MPSIRVVGKHARVVDTDAFTVDEWSGVGVTNEDRVSVAQCRVSAGAAEPWRTSQFDEIFCILKGTYEFEHNDGAVTRADAGSTALVEKDTRFRPRFPTDCLYVAVCLPAFRPELSAREVVGEEGEQAATAGAQSVEVVSDFPEAGGSPALPVARLPEVQSPEVLYHMCPVTEWEEAKQNGVYYPAAYEADGHFTHATGVASRLILTANNFYQDSPGDWVCVSFKRSALRRCGIHVRDEKPMPVGDKPVDPATADWIFPHVIGGIPTHIVDHEYPMIREGKRFTAIDGLYMNI